MLRNAARRRSMLLAMSPVLIAMFVFVCVVRDVLVDRNHSAAASATRKAKFETGGALLARFPGSILGRITAIQTPRRQLWRVFASIYTTAQTLATSRLPQKRSYFPKSHAEFISRHEGRRTESRDLHGEASGSPLAPSTTHPSGRHFSPPECDHTRLSETLQSRTEAVALGPKISCHADVSV